MSVQQITNVDAEIVRLKQEVHTHTGDLDDKTHHCIDLINNHSWFASQKSCEFYASLLDEYGTDIDSFNDEMTFDLGKQKPQAILRTLAQRAIVLYLLNESVDQTAR